MWAPPRLDAGFLPFADNARNRLRCGVAGGANDLLSKGLQFQLLLNVMASVGSEDTGPVKHCNAACPASAPLPPVEAPCRAHGLTGEPHPQPSVHGKERATLWAKSFQH